MANGAPGFIFTPPRSKVKAFFRRLKNILQCLGDFSMILFIQPAGDPGLLVKTQVTP
jgi:hypothetical protein